MNKSEYKEYARRTEPRSPVAKNAALAFTSGGAICCAGQGFFDLYTYLGADEKTARLLVPCTLILVAVILTGIGVYDSIAKHAGAGTLVPITGFANAVASPAIDARAEGMITGVGAKIFTVAGPVILYGVLASVIYGLVFYLIRIAT